MKEIKLLLTFKTNVHVGTGFGFARIVDNTIVKDRAGIPYIPASSIKGRLRAICRRIEIALDGNICQTNKKESICKVDLPQNACIICKLFGSPYQEGKIIFSNAVITDDERKILAASQAISPFRTIDIETRAGIQLSRVRKISMPKHLFFSENVSSDLHFATALKIRRNLEKGERELLEKASQIISFLGGQKARGLGKLHKFDFQFEEES